MANSTPHFKISAAVVKQLGEELITDEVTAFMELVKNSYDADSTRVTIDINTIDKPKNKHLLEQSTSDTNPSSANDDNSNTESTDDSGYISVKDNGCGMTKDDIENRWMTISLSEKRNSAKSGLQTGKGRTYLGEKGVGRLSTQRLGNTIDLITGVKGESHFNHLYFDWSSFSEEVTLDSVIPGYNTIPKQLNESGTEIIIRGLKSKEVWTGESYAKMVGQLSQLISPKSPAQGGFKIHLKKNNAVQDLIDINESINTSYVTSFLFELKDDIINIHGIINLKKMYGSSKANHANFEKYLAPDNGKDFFDFLTNVTRNKKEHVASLVYDGKEGKFFTWNFKIKIDEIPELIYVEKRDEDDNLILDENNLLVYELAHPGPFAGKINDYSFTKDFGQILDGDTNIKTIIQNQTGIRIYRDGFGIKPYGINSQDWLKLGSGNTSGASFYGLRPYNVVGYVEISAKHNYYLREKTDREGFIESPHSINFFKIMEFIIKQINLTLEKTRRSFNDYIKSVGTANVGIDPIQESFDSLNTTAQSSRKVQERMTEVNTKLENAKARIKDISIDSLDKKLLKEQLSNLTGILSESTILVDEISQILVETKKLDTHVSVLKPKIESLEEQLTEFTDLASLGLTAEALSHELSNIADKLYEQTNSIIKKFAKKIPPELFQLNTFLESVKSSVTSFRKQLSHLDPALKYVRESKEAFTITSFFNELKEYYYEKFGDVIQIEIVDNSEGAKLYVNKGKLIQIIDNIVLNAEYWLKDNLKRDKHFKPVITLEITPPYIRISDNGKGIPHVVEETLFQPFVTLKPKGVGRGLGLFIVQQLLDSIGCSITLLPVKNNQGNRFTFQIYINSLITQ